MRKLALFNLVKKASRWKEDQVQSPEVGECLGLFKEQQSFHCEQNEKSLEGFE